LAFVVVDISFIISRTSCGPSWVRAKSDQAHP